MKVKFYLLRPKSKTETGLICSVSYDKKRIRFCIKESVNPKFWNPKTSRARITPSFPESAEFNQKLNNIASKVNKLYLDSFNANEEPPTKAMLERYIRSEILRENTKLSFFDFYQDFIDKTAAGGRVNSKGKVIRTDAAKYYKTALKILKEYRNNLEFEDITLEFYNDFVSYLNGKGLSINTVGDNIKKLKAVMAAALELGYHKNTAFQGKYFTKPSEEADNIYLSIDELKEIETLDLSSKPSLDRVRDLFLIGCYTGLRFSDYSRLTPKNIANGFIEIEQLKTGERVVIPVHSIVKKIISKYNGLPATISNQKFNNYLKEICQDVKCLQETESKTTTKAGKKVTVNMFKWQMVSSHTARRSFATNEYLNGTSTLTIMAVTGHKTEKAFLKYIKVSNKEEAERMKQYWEKREAILIAI
jgi:integrase